MTNIGPIYEIKDDNTFIYMNYGVGYKLDIKSLIVDDINQIISITTEGQHFNGCTVAIGDGTNVFEYILIYDKEQLVNICLIGYDDICWHNENGIIADLEGIYINDTGDERLVLKPKEKQIDYQYFSENSGMWYSNSSYPRLYLKLNGMYWIDDDWAPSFVINENTLSFKGQRFTKVNE